MENEIYSKEDIDKLIMEKIRDNLTIHIDIAANPYWHSSVMKVCLKYDGKEISCDNKLIS